MPPIASMTQLQVREAVGRNLRALNLGYTSDTQTGTTEITLYDSGDLPGADNQYRGQYILIRTTDSDSAADGSSGGDNTRKIQTSTDGTLVIPYGYSTGIDADQQYELWEEDYPPQQINNFIAQAIQLATGKAYDPEEDISLHLHPEERRYDIPTVFAAISKLEYRKSYIGEQISAADATWTTAGANTTQAADNQDKKQGSGSLRLTVAAAAPAGEILASLTLSAAQDWREYDTVELSIKSSVATAAGDLSLQLREGATTRFDADIPVLAANVWTHVRVQTTGNASLWNAIDAVRLEYTTDLGAVTIWIDDLKIMRNGTEKWEKIAPHFWSIDKEAADLILKPELKVPYGLLKITGGDEPALPADDGDTLEIDPHYVIAKATELALRSTVTRTASDAQARTILANYWFEVAERRLRAFTPLVNYRLVT